MKKIRLKALSKAIELPPEYVAGCSKITITDYGEAEILNYKNIIEYTDSLIRINCADRIIKLTGAELLVDNITDNRLVVSGKFFSLSFE